MGPELATGAGAAAARRGRAAERKEAENCILTRVFQTSLNICKSEQIKFSTWRYLRTAVRTEIDVSVIWDD